MSKRIESAIQRALVTWIRDTYPDVKIVATLNENSRTQLAMGVDVGIPDLLLMVKRMGCLNIFFLELKTKKGKLKESQKDWESDYSARFAANNTAYAVAYGFSEAKRMIVEWMTSQPL